LVFVAVVLPLLVAGLVGLLYFSGVRTGEGFRTPAACSLLTQAQVAVYVPGAVQGADGDGYYCPWSEPLAAKDPAGRLIVAVETLPGERPTVEDAKREYGVRRRQADKPGTTITSLSIGDETFMACAARSCETYTRVRNVVFSLDFESYPVANAREPASSVRALAAEAVSQLRHPS
jgi:hypothetical protein